VADLAAREGNRAREVRQLEEYQQRWGGAPEEWLAIQARIARVHDRAGSRDAARKVRLAALSYYRQKQLGPAQAGERGMPPVAEGMLLELEPGFAAWDRITLDVKPRFLKAQLQVKGKKLLELEKQYGAVVQLKQAEAAVCALYRIGLLYQHFARSLTEAPVPAEIRRQPELVKEYRAQLATLAEAPQAKAVEGMEIAANKSRELGVQNECSRDAVAVLAKARPERWGPLLEKIPEPARATARERTRGYGLLSAPKDWEALSKARAAPPARPLAPLAGAPPRAAPAATPDLDRPPAVAPARPAAGPAASTPRRDDRPPVPQPGDREDEELLP